MALEVLRGEMAHRGLKPEAAAEALADHQGMPPQEFGTKLPDGSAVLITFHDAMAAGKCMRFSGGRGDQRIEGECARRVG